MPTTNTTKHASLIDRAARRGTARALALCAALTGLSGCLSTSHAVRGGTTLGRPSTAEALEATMDQPGPVSLEVVKGADWAVPRSGLINLDNPKAKAAGLKDGDEPIKIFTYVLRHPTKGVFLVDTGVAEIVARDPKAAGIGMLVRSYLKPEILKLGESTDHLVARLGQPLAGVFLTHVHLDHMTGLPGVPKGTPIVVGPGEAAHHHFMNAFTQGTFDNMLEGHAPLEEWRFAADPTGRFAGVVDVFGDGSVFALLVPGHTAGSTAFVVRTPQGPVLLTGDVCHTRWGWEHDVEPGEYTEDHDANVASLKALRALAARHPAMTVRLGHQD